MVTHMKTTIEINDDLLIRAKARAREENKTLRALFEEILREALVQRVQRKRKFRLKDGSFKGDGLQPGVDPKRLIEYAYRDRID